MKKILVVDDEEMIRQFIFNILDLDGHKVETADNGKEAIDILRGGGFDLLISDLAMPVMNGYRLLDVIRSDEKLNNLPVLIVSATVDKDIIYELGANDYISKPFEIELLKKKVVTLLKI